MRAYKCDRCGKLYESQLCVPDIRISKYIYPEGEEWVDLCPECQHFLEEWLKGERK